MDNQYRFSIIMAVYNVESYLDEAIESILNQDIGFEEHVQLILVDDGSEDSSGRICEAYARQYPQNIIVLHQKKHDILNPALSVGALILTSERFRSEKSLLLAYIEFFKLKHDPSSIDSHDVKR